MPCETATASADVSAADRRDECLLHQVVDVDQALQRRRQVLVDMPR